MRKTNVHQGNPSTARTLWFSLIACVLFIAFIPSNSAFGQNTIACGETKTGTISTAGQMDSYTFQGTSGDAVVIAAAATSGSLGAKAALYNPSGTRIAENGYYGNGPTASVTLPVSGTYTIFVYDYTMRYTGGYSVSHYCPRRGGDRDFAALSC